MLSQRKEEDQSNDLHLYTNKKSSNILHFTRLTDRFNTTLTPEGSRTHYLKIDRKSQIDKLSNPQHSK